MISQTGGGSALLLVWYSFFCEGGLAGQNTVVRPDSRVSQWVRVGTELFFFFFQAVVSGSAALRQLLLPFLIHDHACVDNNAGSQERLFPLLTSPHTIKSSCAGHGK